MPAPLQITYRDVMPSPALSREITRRVAKLGRFHPRILGCHVVIAAPRPAQRPGRLVAIRITVNIPGQDVAVARNPSSRLAGPGIRAAVHDAFDAAERQLEDAVRRRRDIRQRKAAVRRESLAF
jgi:ribosome-associated translation inhibitor RaiA